MNEKIPLDTYRNLNLPGLQRRRIDVWLPPQYADSPEQFFPVLYMHDGQNIFDRSKYVGTGWMVHNSIIKLAAQGRIHPPIVVGMTSTLNRVGEYLPQKALDYPGGEERVRASMRKGMYQRSLAVGDTYLRWIVELVKPLIDTHYRTLTDPEHTAVMGSSMGGLISLYALCEYPQVFGSAGCLSTHWPILGEAMLAYCQDHLPRSRTHKIYFDHGTIGLDAEYPEWQSQMDTLMREKGYREGKDWATWVFPEDDHNEIAWANRLHIPLAFLFGKI